MQKIWDHIRAYSVLLVLGSVAGFIWANTDPYGYHHFAEMPLWEGGWIGERHGPDGARTLRLHYLVNDGLMALFFAIAGKEVWEAVALRTGTLRGRRALTPLVATLGGMVGPVLVYLAIAAALGSDTWSALARGWAVPTATDIAFSYLVGRIIFGAGHPAVRFLLLLAIADDAGGLLILAVFYPTGALAPAWLLLSLAAAVALWLLGSWLPGRLDAGDPSRPVTGRVRARLGLWPCVIAGAASWYGFMQAGIHPALGLLPIIPAIPNGDHWSDGGPDLLTRFEHALRLPVDFVLFLFGLLNAGVEVGATGPATWAVLGGLLIGKPLGIAAFGILAARGLGFGLPQGMRAGDLPVLGAVAGIGFTVALFVATVAFRVGPDGSGQAVQDAAKMGALLSFAAAPLALLLARLFRVERVRG